MRAIDADALIDKTDDRYSLHEIGRRERDDIVDALEYAPTIRPEPHWIPAEQALPEEPFGCLVTVWDEEPMTGEMFENLLPYFVGWDGEQWNDGDGQQCPFEVIAWMPLPEPMRLENK